MGRSYSELGQLAKAQACFEDVLVIREKVNGTRSLETSMALEELGFCYVAQKMYEAATRLLKSSLAFVEKQLPANEPRLNRLLGGLCISSLELGALVPAERYAKRQVALLKKPWGRQVNFHAVAALFNLGCVYAKQGRLEKVTPLFAVAEKLAKRLPKPRPSEIRGIERDIKRFTREHKEMKPAKV
ncbi:MAG: tetratricopeptide repeat protein [Kiritimatiellaeota bacterium]|nr:tetratricopeptide repeat protein [Kiritimatiellota bacterium]